MKPNVMSMVRQPHPPFGVLCNTPPVCPLPSQGAMWAVASSAEVFQQRSPIAKIHCHIFFASCALSCPVSSKRTITGPPPGGGGGLRWLTGYWRNPLLWGGVGFAKENIKMAQMARLTALGEKIGHFGTHWSASHWASEELN